MYEVDQNLQSVESHPGDATVPGPPFSPRQNGHAATQDAQGPLDQPWQALLDSAGEGIWGVDLEGRCTFVNRAALGMLGFEAEELVGSNMHEMVHHHYIDGSSYPAENCCVYNVFRKNRPFSNQVDHIFRKDGTHFWTEMSAQPILQEGELRGAVVTFRDITQTRMAEDALRRSEKLAAVGQLASSIAHEINNPLEAVLNLVYLVRNSETLDEARTYATLAESELVRVADIALQTLRFHRRQTAVAPVDLEDTISAILRPYASRFPARNIDLKSRMKPCSKALLLEGEIRQVLNNLIRNAYDAMPGGGHLHMRLRPASCMKTGTEGLRVSVGDTGTGFHPAMHGHVFEPFHTTKEVTGTGLGLWISKGIIDKHEGRIQMRSRQGVGTLFSIWLPLQPMGHA
jgi:PAS domain S-box-containing protein